MNPYQIVKDFESALCEYTGARFAVTTNSCTMGLLLAVKWHIDGHKEEYPSPVWIPKHTYNSVPMSIIHAGGKPLFIDDEWVGSYELNPYPVWDSARRFTSNMYEAEQFQCVSFHTSKILGDTQGGAILHDNEEADEWFRRARFDGRAEGVAPKDDEFTLGYHCYMFPDTAARLLMNLHFLPKHNKDLPNDEYADLSLQKIFQ